MRLAIALAVLLLITACTPVLKKLDMAGGPSLPATSHDAVSKMLSNIPLERQLDPRQPILVASLVQIDDLKSTRLGRIISEQLMTQLVASGYSVTELKLRDAIYIRRNEGEYMLSREVPEISRRHAAQAVLVGTYAQALNNLYVTLKLVATADNQIIAAHDYYLPIDGEIRSLLWSKTP